MRTGTESISKDPQLNILSHPLGNEQELCPVITYRPVFQIELFLLDTGASVSAIAENIYTQIKNKTPKYEIPTFPLSGIFLTTAVTKKSVKIDSQIYLTFNIDNNNTHAIFLVVPKLFTPLILGTDWLLENNVQTNYETKQIILPSLRTVIR